MPYLLEVIALADKITEIETEVPSFLKIIAAQA